MPTYIYTRYSTEKQSEDSLEIQESQCRNYAERERLEVDGVFADPETSAKHLVTERPNGRLLTAILRPGDNVIALKPDRLTRHSGDITLLTYEWREQLVNLHFVEGGKFDLSNATSRFMLKNLIITSEFERELISERTAAKAKYYRENGKRWGAIPVGKKCVNGKLVDDECEREAVAKAKRIRSAGKSYREVAAQLADLGYLNRKGEPYHHNQVRRMCG